MRRPAALALLVLWPVLTAGSDVLQLRFIGNSAFEITDGRTTVLTDFPYRGGHAGYMDFDPAELRPRPRSLCLFTHAHADHFAPEALAAVGCLVAGPGPVLAAVPGYLRAGDGPAWQFGAAKIRCLSTAHGAVAHCSWLVDWSGLRLFVSGDVEDLDFPIPDPERLDAVLLAEWLVPRIPDLAARFPGAQIVVHHHAGSGPAATGCPHCRVPAQGERFDLDGSTGGRTEADR